jgi:hypothetical protein
MESYDSVVGVCVCVCVQAVGYSALQDVHILSERKVHLVTL